MLQLTRGDDTLCQLCDSVYCHFTNFRCGFIFGIFGGRWCHRKYKDTNQKFLFTDWMGGWVCPRKYLCFTDWELYPLSQIRRSIMLDSYLTTYIPQYPVFSSYFTSKRLRNFLSPQFEKEKKVTETPERSGLEPKTIRSRILGLSTWAICELTIAGGKKVNQTISDRTAIDYLCLHCSARYTETRRFRLALFG